jgi:hypothetical protein
MLWRWQCLTFPPDARPRLLVAGEWRQRFDTKAGHARGRPISKGVEDWSLERAFLAWQLGLKPR